MPKPKRKTVQKVQIESTQISWNQIDFPCVFVSEDVIEVSKTFEQVYGVDQLKAPRIAGNKIIPLKDRRFDFKSLFEPGLHEEVQIDSKTGAVSVDIEVIPVRDQENTFIALIRNQSDKRKLEHELIQSQIELRKTHEALVQSAKLASLGELASGVAHELNQPLQAVLGFSQELEHIQGVRDDAKNYLLEIINAANKMKEIINSLRTYARNSPEERSQIGIGHCIQEAIRITAHSLLQEGVEIDWQPPQSENFIFANGIQIEQLFVNLFTNARDAILQVKRSGKITVRMTTNSQGFPVVLVRDDGCGMNEETKAKIFDPFFTTKPVGKGTGLGMSIVHSISNKFGIHIQVESEVSKGTTFILTFQNTLNTEETHV